MIYLKCKDIYSVTNAKTHIIISHDPFFPLFSRQMRGNFKNNSLNINLTNIYNNLKNNLVKLSQCNDMSKSCNTENNDLKANLFQKSFKKNENAKSKIEKL